MTEVTWAKKIQELYIFATDFVQKWGTVGRYNRITAQYWEASAYCRECGAKFTGSGQSKREANAEKRTKMLEHVCTKN